MGRTVRMSAAEALAAGLIDPVVAGLKGPGRKPEGPGVDKKPAKRNRSISRPALHPNAKPGLPGKGEVVECIDGKVQSAVFVFDLVPVPKERPRVVTNPSTDKAFGYTPARTKHFTAEVGRVVRDVFGPRAAIGGPVTLDMTFVMQVPKSWPKWKKQAALDGLILPTSRPDMDNLEKALLDAFNKCLIEDDAYVVDRTARKIYGEVPRIDVSVKRLRALSLNAKREEVEALGKMLNDARNGDAQ